MTTGQNWALMRRLPRTAAARLRAETELIPTSFGVYAWFFEGDPVYSGKAAGHGGLRSRLTKHLATGAGLSRSSLRRNVCEQLLGIPSSVTRNHAFRVTPEEAAIVNAKVEQFSLAWHILPAAGDAVAFEKALHREWLPPLGKR